MSRRGHAFATVLVAFALALTGALTVAPPATALDPDQAQTYYLAKVCSLNPAVDRLNRAIFRGHATVRARQMHGRRLRQARAALLNMRNADVRVGRALSTPPSPWPTPESAQATKQLGQALVRDGLVMLAQRKRAGKRFLRYWNTVAVPHDRLLGRLDGVASKALAIPADATC